METFSIFWFENIFYYCALEIKIKISNKILWLHMFMYNSGTNKNLSMKFGTDVSNPAIVNK